MVLAEREFTNEIGTRIYVALREAKDNEVTIVIETIRARHNSSSESTVTRKEASALSAIISKGLKRRRRRKG